MRVFKKKLGAFLNFNLLSQSWPGIFYLAQSIHLSVDSSFQRYILSYANKDLNLNWAVD
jgi:hypothetical protein